MSLLKLAWKNIIHNPLNLLLVVLLFALGVGLINFLLTVNEQMKDKFDKNLAGIDMVVGAKGSPLQMILCNMYHIDNPTGNITVKEARPFLNPKHPLIKKAVPLSLGDSYEGFRIVGTDYSILEIYAAEIETGALWKRNLEVSIGKAVADKTGLQIGDSFLSSHGFVQDDDFAHDHAAFKVVGILKETGSVVDQLILCNTATVWEVHDHEEGAEDHDEDEGHDHDGHDHDGHDHAGHDHAGHDHDDHTGHDHGDHAHHDHAGHNHEAHAQEEVPFNLMDHPDKEITSVLVQFKSRSNFQALNMPRNINQNTDLMAASPAIEINRLYDMIGVGSRALQMLAFLISLVSAISIFISLFNSLKSRKYELALIRVMGAKPVKLFTLIILEGIILALISFVVGILLSHIALWFMAENMSESYKYSFSSWSFGKREFYLLLFSLLIGFLASVIPAWRAYRTDIHETLSKI